MPMPSLSSLRWRLAAMMLPAALSTLLVLGLGLWGLSQVEESARRTFVAKDVVADILPPPMYLIEARRVLSLASEQNISPDEAWTTWQRLKGEYEARVTHWQTNPPYGLERDLLGAQHEAGMRFLTEAEDRVLKPLKEGDMESAQLALPLVHVLYQEHRQGVDATVKAGLSFADASTARMDRVSLRSPWAMALATALLLGLAAWLYLLVSRQVLRQVQRAAEMADSVASGNLSVRHQPSSRDEVGRMLGALNQMAGGLQDIVGGLRRESDGVTHTAQQVESGAQRLAERSDAQRQTMDHTLGAIQGMSHMVDEHAQTAERACSLSTQTCDSAQQGGSAVQAVVQTMQDIQQASQRISEIIGVIDGIAFQTNILALNAAVEAARAGEQGRGFAVVAAEVRALAQRSATAAREIKGLITASVEKVNAGQTVVQQAGHTMVEVVAQVQQTRELIDALSEASRGQRSHISHIRQAIDDLAQHTQDNLQLVDEMRHSAHALSEQAQGLRAGASRFTLGV